jgi:RimJ/RimL family protein N-acetyltransferase
VSIDAAPLAIRNAARAPATETDHDRGGACQDGIVIATARLLLRPPRAEEAAEALEMLGDPDVRRWNPAPSVVDLDSAAEWSRQGADWSGGDHATFSILDAATGAYLGAVSLHSIDPVQADAEIGYRITPRARGRGVAAEAVTAATAWAFEHLPLVRIELAHAVANPPSCAVALRAGYPLEGVLRKSFVYGDGRRYDEHLHARLAGDAPPGSQAAGDAPPGSQAAGDADVGAGGV